MTSDHIPSVLVPGFLLREHRAELERAAAERATLVGDDDPGVADRPPDDLEVIVTGMDEAAFDRAIALPTVRWVHSVSAGVEHLPLDLMAERGIVLTNSAGAYATAMAEYVVGATIMLARNLPGWLEGQRERRWLDAEMFGASLLRGKRLGVVGYGSVGRELASAGTALGMEVWATKRTPLFLSGEPLDRLLPADGLHELLAASDVVATSASLNRTTEAMIGETELGVMKPTAILVNVARGGLIDEEALVRALTDGRIRGAMLDVTREEPLPEDSPLWTTPNLLITPHISGNAPESWKAAVGFLCSNLKLYLAGTPERMGNLVDYAAVR
ncbi:MAG: D-2-hydroxyacid dehydrogenase [Actinomycetota bacterium]